MGEDDKMENLTESKNRRENKIESEVENEVDKLRTILKQLFGY